MNIFKALEFFCLFSGIEKEEAVSLIPLITSCATAIEKRLYDPSFAESDEAAEAAGALAFYRHCLTEEAAVSGGFTAGSVRIEEKNSSQKALENFKTVLQLHSDIFVCCDMVFFGVK